MASLMPQFSLQTEPQRFTPPTSISTSTRPSAGSLPPARRTWRLAGGRIVSFLVSLRVLLNACVCKCFRPHLGLQASVGDVAADRHVPVVLAGVEWHRPVLTLCDRPLPACALHTVHVDGTGAYGRRSD